MWPASPFFIKMWPAYVFEFETPVLKGIFHLQIELTLGRETHTCIEFYHRRELSEICVNKFRSAFSKKVQKLKLTFRTKDELPHLIDAPRFKRVCEIQ